MKIISEVKDAKKIAIGGHVRPDGDCVCSVMALYRYLQKELPETQIDVYLEKPATVFDCIQDIDKICSDFQTDQVYDVFFALDSNDERLGDALSIYQKAGRRINIDHHISNTGCGDLNIIEPQRSSTAELLYDLMDPEKVDEEIAKAVYLGIAHDTGVFRYSNTSPIRWRWQRNYSGLDLISPRCLSIPFMKRHMYRPRLWAGRCWKVSVL